jgi:hypothetical protein
MREITCSWCQMYRPGQDARVVGASPTGGHGICAECKLTFLAESVTDTDAASPCCGLVGELLRGQQAGEPWRRCPCGAIYLERLLARKE